MVETATVSVTAGQTARHEFNLSPFGRKALSPESSAGRLQEIKISEVWEKTKATNFPNYSSGTMGPDAADELLKKDGFFWWPVTDLDVEICK